MRDGLLYSLSRLHAIERRGSTSINERQELLSQLVHICATHGQANHLEVGGHALRDPQTLAELVGVYRGNLVHNFNTARLSKQMVHWGFLAATRAARSATEAEGPRQRRTPATARPTSSTTLPNCSHHGSPVLVRMACRSASACSIVMAWLASSWLTTSVTAW